MAKPKLCLIPAAQGSKLFSVLPSSGVGDFDFSRSGKATRINSQGLIEEVSNGQSRLNYPMIDGKVVGCPHHILEPQRTNIVNYSEDFSNSYWTKSNTLITSNSVISPDGTLNADKFVEDFSNTAHRLFANQIAVVSGSSYTFSLFAKYKNRQYLQLTFNGTQFNSTQFATFDLINGVVSGFSSSVANIEKYKNGWYRLIFTATATVTSNTSAYIITSNVPNLRDPSYQGDGSSVYIYGAQLEEGSYATSYIPTNGSSVTRNAETCNGAGDSATFNDSEGVLMVEASALAKDGTNRYISISDGSDANRLYLRYRASNNVFSGGIVVNNSLQVLFDTTDDNILNFSKFLLKYKENDFEFWLNGFKLLVDTSGSTFPNGTLNQLRFDTGGTGVPFYGKTKQIQYYNSALTDSELEQLTSWTSFSDMAQGQQYSII